MGIINIHFGHSVGKYGPDTEFPSNFCVGIGPLQVDVVLILFTFNEIFAMSQVHQGVHFNY